MHSVECVRMLSKRIGQAWANGKQEALVCGSPIPRGWSERDRDDGPARHHVTTDVLRRVLVDVFCEKEVHHPSAHRFGHRKAIKTSAMQETTKGREWPARASTHKECQTS